VRCHNGHLGCQKLYVVKGQSWSGLKKAFWGVQGAFGVTGVEGLYRSSCEAVLTSLRRNSQAVMLMMEAILLDPLVEWAPHREDAAANQVGTLFRSTWTMLETLLTSNRLQIPRQSPD
jgi:phosphatidylinositol kinase/protein kinase (PI-3  family)